MELFYRNGSNELVAVQFTEGPDFVPGRQDVLFRMDDYQVANGGRVYDVRADDQEFVMLREDSDDSELILFDNWAEEFRERVRN